MNLNLFPFVVIWCILAAVVLAMIAWRKAVARHEDHIIHMLDAAPLSQQTTFAHKLEQIDKWGKTLTVLTVVSGVLLALIYAWQSWVRTITPDGL